MFGRIALILLILIAIAFFWPIIRMMAEDAMDARRDFQRELKERAERRKEREAEPSQTDEPAQKGK